MHLHHTLYPTSFDHKQQQQQQRRHHHHHHHHHNHNRGHSITSRMEQEKILQYKYYRVNTVFVIRQCYFCNSCIVTFLLVHS